MSDTTEPTGFVSSPEQTAKSPVLRVHVALLFSDDGDQISDTEVLEAVDTVGVFMTEDEAWQALADTINDQVGGEMTAKQVRDEGGSEEWAYFAEVRELPL